MSQQYKTIAANMRAGKKSRQEIHRKKDNY